MEIIALVIGMLIGLFAGIVLHGKHLKKAYAGTLMIVRADPNSEPQMYLDQIEEPTVLEKKQCVLMSVKTINVDSQK